MAAKKKATKSKGTRKSTLKSKRQKNARMTLILKWVRRGVVAACFFALIGWCAVWFAASDADTRVVSWVRNQTLQLTAQAGFKVKDILVEGRHYSNADVLLGLINVQKGDPLFAFKPTEAKEQIEKITWVKSARVERRLPDTVYVRLEERKPVALWQHDGVVAVIDDDGTILTQQDLNLFKDLLMVRGIKAPEHATHLLSVLEGEQKILSLTDHAELIDGRRWNLYLNDGKKVKLPADDIALALRHIVQQDEENNILGEEAIADIDARYAGRLIIRTKLGKVQDYRASEAGKGTAL